MPKNPEKEAAYKDLRIAALEAELAQARAECERLRGSLRSVVRYERSFRWDSEKQCHVPWVLVEFAEVPAGCPNDELGWRNRDAFAVAIDAAPPSAAQPVKLWLWKNFVDGRPEYWAFDNPYPIHMDCGDPQTVGEPVGYALVKQSRNGRPDVSEEQVLSSIKRTAPPDLAARVARLEDALRGMLELAEYWFMRENRRGYSEEQYKAWYSLGFDSNEFKNARAALARWEA